MWTFWIVEQAFLKPDTRQAAQLAASEHPLFPISSHAVHDISKTSTQSYVMHCMTFPKALLW